MKTLRKITGCALVIILVCCICVFGNTDQEYRELAEESRLQDALDENGAFPIDTAKDFAWFCDYVRSGHEDLNGILLADIDLEEAFYCVKDYRGHFDGGGHIISGSISELFLVLKEGARVENLTVEAHVVNEDFGAAGLVWRNFGEIVNCEVSGYIEGKGYTGGIASANYGWIENCVNRAKVVSTGDAETYDYVSREDGWGAGGIAGLCATCGWEDCGTEIKITGCSNYGEVTAKELAGGICARLEDRTNEAAPNNSIQEMVEIDGFSLEDDGESGDFPEKRIHGSLADCRNYGEVEVERMVDTGGAYTKVAGICGELYQGDIYHCANLGRVAISETASKISDSGWIYANRPMAITYNMGYAQSTDRHIVDCISLKGAVSNTMRHENVMEVTEEEVSLWEEGKLAYRSNNWMFDLEDAVYTCSMEPLFVREEEVSKGRSSYYACEEFALCLPEYCEITEESINNECYALKIRFTGEGADEDGTGRYIAPGDEAWLLHKQVDMEEALSNIHKSNTLDTWRIASFAEFVFQTIPNYHMLKIESLSLPGHKCFGEATVSDKRIYLRNAIPGGSQRKYMGEGDAVLGNVFDILLEGNYEDGLWAEWIFVFTNSRNNIRPSDTFIDLVEEGFYPLGEETEEIRVQRGESLWRIAKEYLGTGTGWKMLSAINGVEEPNLVREGEAIRVPRKEVWEKKPESVAVWWLLQEEEPEPVREDADFYVQCLQNKNQGNSITYAEGYYYFRSQTENYSLCRTRGTGMPVEVVADQMPGAVYVRENQVYFINVSDDRSLYRVGTDGSGLEKLSDFPMQELVVLEDKIYFRSVYDRESDPFYQLTEEAAEDDRYLYVMNLDGSGCELLIPKVCMEFTTDGERLYYQVLEEGEGYVLYKNSLDGKNEEKILQKDDRIWDIVSYQGDLYWVNVEEENLVRLNAQGEEEVLASDVWRLAIAHGQAYVTNDEEIRGIALATGEENLVAKREKAAEDDGGTRKDSHAWYEGVNNRGIFFVNGQVFTKYYESDEKGVLWHILDGESFVVFEDMAPLNPEELVRDTSLLYETNFYYPGDTDEGAVQYLDGELYFEESFGTREDGSTYGDFRVTLPKFNDKIASGGQLNRQMEELMELALKDKESFFREIGELDQEQWISWRREHGYSHLYIGENYISMYYYRGGYDGGMRDWKNSMPLIFDRETGIMLHMDDLFTAEKSVYLKRLTGAVYKYCEMMGNDYWNDVFDNNVLVKNLGDLRAYLTTDGMVLCYERYEIQAGASGSPTFEIPYEWFADIFKGQI